MSLPSTLPPGKSRKMRVNHHYDRGGAVAYLAAYDVHRAKVFGRCEQTTGIEPFRRLVLQVMTAEPYASAKRVFWIVDNESSHRGQAVIDRLAAQYLNAIMVHTPVHASWLNQVSRSTSPSSDEKYSRPTTSSTSTRSSTAYPPSRPATTRQPDRSNGSSPPPTSPTFWTGSTSINPRRPETLPNPEPHDSRRTYERNHLVRTVSGGRSRQEGPFWRVADRPVHN